MSDVVVGRRETGDMLKLMRLLLQIDVRLLSVAVGYTIICCLLLVLLRQQHNLSRMYASQQIFLEKINMLSERTNGETLHTFGKPTATDAAFTARVKTSAANVTSNSCIVTKTAPSFSVCVHPSNKDKFVSSSLVTIGSWEPHITKLMQKALTLYRNATLIDIGAHIGYYSLLAAAMGHNAVAIEPLNTNIDLLQMSTNLNNFTQDVTLLTNAVYDRQTYATLTSNQDNQGGVWIKSTNNKKFISETMPNIVRTITLDDVIPYVKQDSDIIKIDIEGFECRAFMKSTKFFTATKVLYIFMEWQKMFASRHSGISPCPSSALQSLSDRLSQLGFVPYEIKTGFQLDPSRCTTKWRIGDVYWKHRDSLPLQAPY